MREYVWLGDMPVAVVSGATTATPVISYVHTDHLARPVRMTSQSGAIAWWAVYAPFGAVHATGGALQQDMRFPGQWFQLETGLAYNWNRHYDATLGRYVQPDPIGFAGGRNLYGYVDSNPLAYVDPRGLCCECPKIPNGSPSNASERLRNNMDEAYRHGYDPFWFKDQVQSGAQWDYKQFNQDWQDFGNFNYGATGASAGLPDQLLLRAAGWAQLHDRNFVRPEFGSPYDFNWTGPYGDDPRDQEFIRQGIKYAKCAC